MGISKTKTEVSAGDILENFGKYQILQYFYLCLPPIFVSMINVNYIFIAGEVNYRWVVIIHLILALQQKI